MDKTNYERLEDLLLSATPEELPGLLEHARLVVKIRGMLPTKRAYNKKAPLVKDAAQSILDAPHPGACSCDTCQTARAQA